MNVMRLLGLGLCAVLAATCGACGGADDDGPRSTPQPTPCTAPIACIADDGINGGDAALLRGELGLVGECLVVIAPPVSTEDPATYIPIFESDEASWDAEASVLSLGGDEFAVGDVLSLGGGEAAGDLAGATIPSGCPDDAGLWVVSTRK